MQFSQFLKKAVEEKYLNKTIIGYNGGTRHVVDTISVYSDDDGASEISFHDGDGYVIVIVHPWGFMPEILD